MISMKIEGLESVTQKLKAYSVAKKSEIEKETTKALIQIHNDAKKDAPVNKKVGQGGRLRSSIHWYQSALSGEVKTNVKYAPYVEFGTGTLVSVPNELQELAMQFKGAGVRQVNLPAQPFLYPAFFKERKNYPKRIEKVLGNETI